jgi:uncharacterized protein YkwD
MMAEMNSYRASGFNCPSGNMPPVGPLTMHAQLQVASQLHSWDMSYSNYFSNNSCNGRSFTTRASDQGTFALSEVITAVWSSPASATAALMAASGPCEVVMNGAFTQVGVGYARHVNHVWVGNFQ